MQALASELRIRDIRTRMPFRYGIASMTQVPHAVLTLTVEIDGAEVLGRSAESLVPKWFTKVADSPYRQDLRDMLQVIQEAVGHALAAGRQPDAFSLWAATYEAQNQRATSPRFPALLLNLGVSLVERALLDAVCRGRAVSLARNWRRDAFGFQGGYFDQWPDGMTPAEALPEVPLLELEARHTIGLDDPLRSVDIDPADRVPDGLPQSLDEVVRRYGVRYLKIKIGGDVPADIARLRDIAAALRELPGEFRFTLDGNEQYQSFADFLEFWTALEGDAGLAGFLRGLVFIEQPLHRDVALSPEATAALRAWTDHPPVIVDESDGDMHGLQRALDCGYQGTSHKNCKGIFKSVANMGRIRQLQDRDGEAAWVMSGEDLTNVGPIALLQDLAMLASLGIPHAERNGHHYFTGLSMHEPPVQETVAASHPDLYAWRGDDADRCAAVRIRNGRMSIGSAVDAPFGYGPNLDLTGFQPLANWDDGLYA